LGVLPASGTEEALGSLPKTLVETYERILHNVDEGYRQHAKRALTWVAFSHRPVTIREIAEASILDPYDSKLHANTPLLYYVRTCDIFEK
jgi:hypothetical protein